MRAFVAEERSDVLGGTFLRIEEPYCVWDVNLILTHVCMAMNNMVGQSGFEANQTGFGSAGSDFSSPLLDAKGRDGDLLKDLLPPSPS